MRCGFILCILLSACGNVSNTPPDGSGGAGGSGVDAAPMANGSACTSNGQCISTFCVDGVCCATACAGQCEACDLQGFVGQCSPVTSGQPHGTRTPCAGAGTVCAGQCTSMSPTQCGSYPGPDTMCASQSCTNGTKHLASGCDQLGACAPQATRTCPLGCDSSTNDCVGACTSDTQCSAANPALPYCDAGVCTALKPNGRTCSAGSECNSGICADGYCCDGACTGNCQSCKESGQLGHCIFVTGAPRLGDVPARAACLTDGSTCGGFCYGNSANCFYKDTLSYCGSAITCLNGDQWKAACNGAGSCSSMGIWQICPTGTCDADGIQCSSSHACSADSQCSSGHCLGGNCCNYYPCGSPGEACNADGLCCSTLCSECDANHGGYNYDGCGRPCSATCPSTGYCCDRQHCCGGGRSCCDASMNYMCNLQCG
jgi:hypothetical protein